MTCAGRRGVGVPVILVILAILIAIAVIGTAARRIEISRHAARLELRVELMTALESALEEGYWFLAHADVDTGSGAARTSYTGGYRIKSKLLGEIAKGAATPSTPPERMPAPRARAIRPAGFTVEIEDPLFRVYRTSGGRQGLVAMRVTGHASRGNTSLTLTIEHRRVFRSKTVQMKLGSESSEFHTVHIIPELVDAEVTEG